MTAQIKEILCIDNVKYAIATEPLKPYLSSLNNKPKFFMDNTACWRGYTGEWQLTQDKLYLNSINGNIYNGKDNIEVVDINYLFPNQDRVFASWYTGTIRVPDGKMIKYVHMGYESKYERDLLFNFKKGILIDYEYIDNSMEETQRPTVLKRLLLRIQSIFK
ncbi:hypothetical protein [uncultured Maribacter sp.]|uniref:hypothetical protein n=1 Tax=uncultured Maribacter sp. TaxID=431308 RepID=UPI002639D8BC|nr:hypothetical protein [uncultured Maribacter sp.]